MCPTVGQTNDGQGRGCVQVDKNIIHIQIKFEVSQDMLLEQRLCKREYALAVCQFCFEVLMGSLALIKYFFEIVILRGSNVF